MQTISDNPGNRKGKGKSGNGKGKRSGKGKDSAKGNSKNNNPGGKGKATLSTSDPTGRKKCFRYNRGKPCNGECGMLHVCLYCGDRHPFKGSNCDKQSKTGGDAAGSASWFQ